MSSSPPPHPRRPRRPRSPHPTSPLHSPRRETARNISTTNSAPDSTSAKSTTSNTPTPPPPRISIPPPATSDTKLRTEYLQVPSQSYLRQASQARQGNFDYLANQQVLFQAYLHAIRSGRIQMPSVSLPSIVTQAQQAANHNRTISDVKRGVTYASQDQLKKLPIPPLEDTCKRYLESVKPFLV
jgi:hypothetical protein